MEEGVRRLWREITELLIEKNVTITAMESMTSGFIASLITDTPGASAIFKGSFVTYSNEAKMKFGVPEGILEKYSVYSKETASAMAAACRESFGADVGLGVTALAGNADPENPGECGSLYFAVEAEGKKICTYKKMPELADRHLYKLFAAKEVGEALMDIIKDL